MDKDDWVLLLFTARGSKSLNVQLIHQYSAFGGAAEFIFTSSIENVPLVESFRSLIERREAAYRPGRKENE